MRAAGGGRVPGPYGEGGGAGEEPRRLLQVPRPRSQPPPQKPRLRGRGGGEKSAPIFINCAKYRGIIPGGLQ